MKSFSDIEKQILEEEEKYQNTEVSTENYNFPYIFLTDKEIKEFNEECLKSDIDLKVVSFSDYMNISEGEKDEQDIDFVMNLLGKSFKEIRKKKNISKDKTKIKNMNINDIMNNVNNYIEKKQKKIVNDDDEDDKSSLSFISANNFQKLSQNEKSDKNKEKVGSKNSDKNDNEVPERKTHRKLKKKKKADKNEDINHKFNLHFKKILEAGKQSKEDEQGKNMLINEIQEKSQYLTLEGLKEYAKNKHIKVLGDELSINDLKQKNINQLSSILNDISINTDINKLDINRKENIRTMRNKEEREKKINEKNLKKKKLKEEKKLIELINNAQSNNNNNVQNKMESEDEKSESSYDDDDSLN